MITLDTDRINSFLGESAPGEPNRETVLRAHAQLKSGSGPGSSFLGWRDLLLDPNDALLEDIVSTAARVRQNADVLVCVGIGGSYLGARAVISALTPYLEESDEKTEILFAGHHMSGAYMQELLAYLEGKSVFVNVISKSGTTLEPALAFRFLRDWLERNFEDADDRVIVTTDPEKGALNALRSDHPYKKYVIPPDVGGRFSVLTPVGLLPIAVAGVDIRSLFYGARAMCTDLEAVSTDGYHPALAYAELRSRLYARGYTIEALAVFEPKLSDFAGWWQQLYGESEGKDKKGIFPVGVQYSTDLHSLGQYMQDGRRQLLETFLMVRLDKSTIRVAKDSDNLDGLNYLAGKAYSEINLRAYEGTSEAHEDGGLPNMTIWLDQLTPAAIGELIYFFEHAVAVSGYLLGVNPFDQPGVEAYKKAMFRLLGRPE